MEFGPDPHGPLSILGVGSPPASSANAMAGGPPPAPPATGHAPPAGGLPPPDPKATGGPPNGEALQTPKKKAAPKPKTEIVIPLVMGDPCATGLEWSRWVYRDTEECNSLARQLGLNKHGPRC